jgi:hypothetical protein
MVGAKNKREYLPCKATQKIKLINKLSKMFISTTKIMNTNIQIPSKPIKSLQIVQVNKT